MGFDEAGVRRRGRTVVAVLVAIVCALMLPAVAVAAAEQEFVVNSIGDQADAAPGAGGCATTGGQCTLRAAIEEANDNVNDPEKFDTIAFDEVVFGVPGATIVLADSLPAVVDSLYIRGTGECLPSEMVDPCVGLSGPADDATLRVQGTTNVVIERLAVTDAEVGIEVEDSTAVKVFKSWFGIKLDGSAGPNQTGVFYGPGSDEGVIGNPGEAEEGNVFANNAMVGLDLFGASRTLVSGNSFGVKPDGSTPAPNGRDIEVTSDATGGTEAVDNQIGARMATGSIGGPCDRACNLISGATESGLDLQGDGGDEGPAIGTLVAGNYVGLNAGGTASVANAGAGIRVGTAPQTVIGGPKAGDANYFSGGPSAVSAGPAAPDLVIRGNLVGISGLGGSIVGPDAGFVVDSEGLTSFGDEAIVEGNEISLEGGVGIAQEGPGAWIADNRVLGAATAIWAHGGAGGNLIEANWIEQSDLNAILVENGLNEVVGNRILGAGAAGIAVRGSLSSGVDENLIGGNSATGENEIFGSAGAAIEITNPATAMTTVARNRGSGNTGLFIDLLAVSPGAEGPNGGIAPPAIAAVSASGAAGTGEVGATVRLFRKQTALVGEVEAFLGATTVDEDGAWSFLFTSLLPAGASIAATQTSKAGGTSELATAAIGATDGAAGGAGAGGGGGAGGDKTPPRTAILKAPKAKSRTAAARFRFASDERGTSFQCRLDRRAFRVCSSPKSYAGLRPGRHSFAVRAVDAAGNADPSPAKRAFTILPAR